MTIHTVIQAVQQLLKLRIASLLVIGRREVDDAEEDVRMILFQRRLSHPQDMLAEPCSLF